MKRYSVQAAKPGDLEAVYKIIANQNTMDYGSALVTLEDLQKKWQELNLGNDTCVAYVNNELAGYAELLEGDSPYIYLADRSNVDLAFHLLMILEGKVTSQKKGKVNLFTRVSEKNNTLLQLFASNGYRSNLSFLIMEGVLDEPPPMPEWPEGISVRTFTKNKDEQATYQADEEAAQDQGHHRPLSYEAWVKRMRMNEADFDPSLWFLAWDGDEIAGVALNWQAKESNTGWIDHLSVRQSWRKKGIGKALLLHSFGAFYRKYIHHIKLIVDSKSLTDTPRLYESVGMQTVQQYHIYRKEI
jgi:GNAT superfamily N-acetyltransferase